MRGQEGREVFGLTVRKIPGQGYAVFDDHGHVIHEKQDLADIFAFMTGAFTPARDTRKTQGGG